VKLILGTIFGFILLTSSIGFNIFAEESDFCNNGSLVIFNYTMTDEKLNYMCLIQDRSSVIISVDTKHGGNLTIDLPRKAVNAIFADCESDDKFFVLVNGEELEDVEETKTTDKFRRFSIPITKDSREIKIIGTFVGGTPKNCEYLYEHHRINITPLQQTKLGILPEDVICETGLKLIQKYDGSPACVKPETISKLIERGWINKT